MTRYQRQNVTLAERTSGSQYTPTTAPNRQARRRCVSKPLFRSSSTFGSACTRVPVRCVTRRADTCDTIAPAVLNADVASRPTLRGGGETLRPLTRAYSPTPARDFSRAILRTCLLTQRSFLTRSGGQGSWAMMSIRFVGTF